MRPQWLALVLFDRAPHLTSADLSDANPILANLFEADVLGRWSGTTFP
ncbi:hypothetical protein [Streptomyces sp. NBC_00005]